MSIALSTLIEATQEDNELLTQILSSFSCAQDPDIEHFLHNRAIEFEYLNKARTYLICDAEQYQQDGFCLDQLIIYGYIALAIKVFAAPEGMSNRKRVELDGLSAKIHGKRIEHFPCYLVGQLARNSNVPHDSVSGYQLLRFALDHISESVKEVGGRYMMIECRNEKKLIDFYTANDFFLIDDLPDAEQVQIQMLKKIKK